jgi:sulfatase maturation enzyme AslB (radical SAM superfamily)
MANIGYMQVTRRCNQKCRFCSNPEREEEVSLSLGKKQISALKRKGYLCVVFTGGEPTMSSHLPDFIRHCRDIGYMHKLCTNGQKTADADYLAELAECGLEHVCLSFHSCKPDVQAYLSGNEDSLKNIIRTLQNLQRYPNIAVDILTTINSFNADHLSGNVRFLLNHFPFFHHYTWNHLDPRMNRTAENPETIPKLSNVQMELHFAMKLLDDNGKQFQVERLPLCYMAEYAHHSTETRRIVKKEERMTYFLDERGCLNWTEWKHEKAACCAVCALNEICAGLYQMDVFYDSSELFPVFIDKEEIIRKIMKEKFKNEKSVSRGKRPCIKKER